ncbi:MAG: adenylosuccinate synthase [Planctomycetota bacterium]
MRCKIAIVVGLQWGDEGKGKIIDIIAPEYKWSVRFGGGPNAGHTVYLNSHKIIFHHIPSASINKDTRAIISSGVVLDVDILQKEIETLENLGINIKEKLYISNRAHLIMPPHKTEDTSEFAKIIGTTAQGVGPTYKDKVARVGLRICDFLYDNRERFIDFFKYKQLNLAQDSLEKIWQHYKQNIDNLKNNIVDTTILLQEIVKKDENLLIECAHGTLLDIDFGTYPYVTSSHTTVCGVNAGLGFYLPRIDEVCGVMKAYTTRVGSGPFVSEEKGPEGKILQEKGREFGSTTGRPRRCGWLDFVALKFAVTINNVSYLALTKVDVLNEFKEIPVLVSYKLNEKILDEYPLPVNILDKVEGVYKYLPGWGYIDFNKIESFNNLPANLLKYIEFIEEQLKTPVKIISFGIDKKNVITR